MFCIFFCIVHYANVRDIIHAQIMLTMTTQAAHAATRDTKVRYKNGVVPLLPYAHRRHIFYIYCIYYSMNVAYGNYNQSVFV